MPTPIGRAVGHSLGIAECLAAVRQVYRQKVNDKLLLRALT